MSNENTIQLNREPRKFGFRGEEFEIVYHYYTDNETGEQFTVTELDELNLIQVHNLYRAKYGIPFTEEIIEIREQYGLSASKMSDILGFGVNGYRNYENGEIPSIPHGRYIQLIKDPAEFAKLIQLNRNELEPHELKSINDKVNAHLIGYDAADKYEESYLFGDTTPDEYNGFKKPHIEKIGNMVTFFAQAIEPFKTKMNKLLFYADFLHYKNKGRSISGLKYVAITHGPVPQKYGAIYSTLYEKSFFDLVLVDFDGGIEGEKFIAKNKNVDLDKFNESEWEVLQTVLDTFGKTNTKAIINTSHEENAWQINVENRNLISYKHGFELKYV